MYVEYQERPFTTLDTLLCYVNAFQFLGKGYDQNHVITVRKMQET